MSESETILYFRLKELSSSQARKGWEAARNDLSMERIEKKLNQVSVQIRNDFDSQQKKIENQIKIELTKIKEMLQEMKDEKIF